MTQPEQLNFPDRFVRHGAVRVGPDRRRLRHADGTPFFFLADTAWNGALLSSEQDWDVYLENRAAKGFSAVQFITHAPWTAALTDAEGQVACDEGGGINGGFFDRIGRKIEAINAHGMLAVPVLAWAANFGVSGRLNIGHTAGAGRLIEFIRHQVERFAHHHVLWVLAGDGVYSWLRARKWRRVGREVFGHLGQHAPVALHPAGGSWPYDAFADEEWLGIYGYQSSHSDHPKTLRWLQRGPPATFWKKRPRPTINLEPVYEGIAPIPGRPAFDAYAVRCAVWWSLLNTPTAGVSYGAHGVWSWQTQAAEPLNHTGMGIARPWHEAMEFPGGVAMRQVARLMVKIAWWSLEPDAELVIQEDAGDPRRFIAASKSREGGLVVIFLPAGGAMRLQMGRLEKIATWWWFDPRVGEQREAGPAGNGKFTAPDARDWVLVGRA